MRLNFFDLAGNNLKNPSSYNLCDWYTQTGICAIGLSVLFFICISKVSLVIFENWKGKNNLVCHSICSIGRRTQILKSYKEKFRCEQSS